MEGDKKSDNKGYEKAPQEHDEKSADTEDYGNAERGSQMSQSEDSGYQLLDSGDQSKKESGGEVVVKENNKIR